MQKKMTTEKELLKEALMHLTEVVPVGKAKPFWSKAKGNVNGADAVVQFEELMKAYHIEIRYQVRRKEIGAIQVYLERMRKPNMLVTRYITPPQAEELRRKDIQFLDTVGNMYIRQQEPYVFAYIVGRRDTTQQMHRKTVRLFREAGLRVLFVLLCDPNARTMTYRDIANATDLALGTVSNVFADLKRHGYMRTHHNVKTLTQREYLIDRWAEAFPNELMPKLNPRRYTTNKVEWWRIIDITKYDVLLGGEPAAAMLTKYLHPEIATIYAGKKFAPFARELRLRKDDRGNILVLDKFWHNLPTNPKYPGVVHPLLVFADLLTTNGARNLEVAQMIRKQLLV